MLEIALLIGAVILMAKVASTEERSPIMWGFITFGLCVVSLLIPIPFLRILLALIISFGIMFFLKLKKS
jgi:hypothetical protein